MTKNIPSPCYVLEEQLLINNLEKLHYVKTQADVSIILAFKSFAMWSVFPLVNKYLDGATASSLSELLLCAEEMGTKSHTYAPAYIPSEFKKICKYSSHITFNSLSQFKRFYKETLASPNPISCGIRVNPEYSEVKIDLYNPCSLGSRLGATYHQFGKRLPKGIEGLHFHALCESDSYELEKTLAALEEKFGHLLHQAKWVNMGGGHLITRKDYDVEHLIQVLKRFKEKYKVEVVLEPGSAIAWQTGYLATTILDIVDNHNIKTAILDTSFTNHMPDTLEMPYHPEIRGAIDPKKAKFQYRMGGVSCLAGDYMEVYGFDKKLKVGDRIILEDMMHYTMVKTTTFNGVIHPSIGILTKEGDFQLIREFGYEDFKSKLS